MSVRLDAVAVGSRAHDLCPTCASPRVTAEVHGLTEDGTYRLAFLVQCRCGHVWRCLLCREVIQAEGHKAFNHLRKRHDGVT
jgi:hypothetical protein